MLGSIGRSVPVATAIWLTIYFTLAVTSLAVITLAGPSFAGADRKAEGLSVEETVAYDVKTKQKLPNKVSAADFTFPQDVPIDKFKGKVVMLTLKDGRPVWVRALHVTFAAVKIDCEKLASGAPVAKDHSTLGSGVECKK